MMAPAPVHLPALVDVDQRRAAGDSARDIVRDFPKDSAAWADLAETELKDGDAVTAYAFARTGYHRGLDALRGNGWRGFGPVPWSHEPNRGVIRATALLALAAQAIGEDDEYERCRVLVSDFDPEAMAHTGLAD